MTRLLTLMVASLLWAGGCVENSAVESKPVVPCPEGSREVGGICTFEGQIQIAPTALQDARLDRPYTVAFEATGAAPHIWSLGDDSRLPDGMAFDAATATLGGTPTSPGTFSLVIEAEDAGGLEAATRLDLRVLDADPPPPCVPSGPEVCDGVDNDCNGEIDEVDLDETCAIVNDLGSCQGRLVCRDGRPTCQGPMATEEVCDGFDNDCDGVVDDGLGCDAAPDIAVLRVEASRPENDNRVAVSYTIANLGDAGSGPFTVVVQFSYDGPEGPWEPAGGMQNEGLAPEQATEFEIVTAARPDFDGELSIRVLIDPEERTEDADRANNLGLARVQMGGDICPSDRFEPSQDFETARAIGDGRYEDLRVCQDDEDWYLIQISEDNLIEPIDIRILFDHRLGDIDAEIYTDNGTRLLESNSGDDNERLRFIAPRAGALRLRVFLFEQETRFMNAYTLELARP